MKREPEIRRKASQVAWRHLKHLLEANFRHVPDACSNQRTVIGSEGKSIGVCGLSQHGKTFGAPICDSQFQHCRQVANICAFWQPRRTKLEIKADFAAFLAGSRAEVAAEYPDLAALLWVLDESAPSPTLLDDTGMSEPDLDLPVSDVSVPPSVSDASQEIMPTASRQSAWVRLRNWFSYFWKMMKHG